MAAPGPQCLWHFLVLDPLKSRAFEPVGAIKASSSKVIHWPPALIILALATSVNLRAHTFMAGISLTLLSLVTVPTRTAILSPFPLRLIANLDTDIGALMSFDCASLLVTALQNLLSVLLSRNL